VGRRADRGRLLVKGIEATGVGAIGIDGIDGCKERQGSRAGCVGEQGSTGGRAALSRAKTEEGGELAAIEGVANAITTWDLTVSCVWAVVMELIENKWEGRRIIPSGVEKSFEKSEGVTFSLAGKQVSSNTTFLDRYILELVGSMHR
jgi:hypothetical protein